MRYRELHLRELTALLHMKADELGKVDFHGNTTDNDFEEYAAITDSIHELIDCAQQILANREKARMYP